MNDLISVIVPVYNVEKYLSKCIDSIINQTYKNIEIIIINDGSNDCSQDIIDKYKKKYNNIKSYQQENQGLSIARNNGIKKARGNYLLFIDSDDFIKEDMVEVLYNNLVKYKAQISVVNICLYKNKKIIDEDNNYKIEVLDSENAIKETYINKYFGPYAVNKLYDKKLFKKIIFPVGKKSEDRFIIHKILSNAKKIVYIRETKYFYVQRENSITSKIESVNFDAVDASKYAFEYINKNYNNLRNYALNNYIFTNLVAYNRIIHYSLEKKYKKELKIIKQEINKLYKQIDYTILSSKDKLKIVLFKNNKLIYNFIIKKFY
ncbi:MAG: glycosyltransferase family 2 protein [Bacilli bacterium]|nr:glycosyltransferase family 2 protein [Bacilli bacterium]